MAGMSAASEAIRRPVNGGMNMSLKNATLTAAIERPRASQLSRLPGGDGHGAWSDEDWGSAGPAAFSPSTFGIAAGKDGIGYPIKTTSLGGTKPADLATLKPIARNWQRLLSG